MRNKSVLISLWSVLTLMLLANASAKIITVDDDGPADFDTIQAAIDNVNTIDGDEIAVSEGTYYETINPNGKAITLRSTNPLDPNTILNTVINANGTGRCITCNSGEDANTVIEGFLITGGYGSAGGGIFCYNSSPTLTNCTFSGNSAIFGGGMYCDYSSDPTLTNCTFSGNSASDGGGMYCYDSDPTLTNCTFSGNSANGSGGGMYCDSYSNPTLTDSLICGNFLSGTLTPNQIYGSYTDNGGNIINDICPPPKPLGYSGDLDDDGDVDLGDFVIFANNWLVGVE